ncbi:MAG: flagellar protein FliT [Bdellovibrionales bacterium]
MNRLITLIYEKNHYLEKFYAQNEVELKNFLTGEFANLDSFYSAREKILEMIRYVDAQIERIQNSIQLSDFEKKELRKALRIKDEYVERILQQDLEVLSCIDRAKSEIISELQQIRKGKKAISGYKMPDFQKSLDEEA